MVKKRQKSQLKPWTAGGFLVLSVTVLAGLTVFVTDSPPSQVTQKIATSTDYQTQTLGSVIEKKTVMVFDEEVAFKKVTIKDPMLTPEQSYVQTEGVAGKRNVTYEVTYTDGKETDRVVLTQKVLIKPIAQVTVKGTKKVVVETEPKPQVHAAQTTKPSEKSKVASEPEKNIKRVKKYNNYYCLEPGDKYYDWPGNNVVGMYATEDDCLKAEQ